MHIINNLYNAHRRHKTYNQQFEKYKYIYANGKSLTKNTKDSLKIGDDLQLIDSIAKSQINEDDEDQAQAEAPENNISLKVSSERPKITIPSQKMIEEQQDDSKS